jgi:TPR repeat protein
VAETLAQLRIEWECGADGAELGFLLSKGSSGIKKDMKEAARWYRMAVSAS